jgi:hypothetical protein
MCKKKVKKQWIINCYNAPMKEKFGVGKKQRKMDASHYRIYALLTTYIYFINKKTKHGISKCVHYVKKK